MFRQIIGLGIIILLLAFLAGLVALNYYAVAALLIGAIISWPLVRLVRFIVTSRTRILLTVVGILILFTFLVFSLGVFPAIGPSPSLISGYHLTIDQSNWKTGIFSIKETATINPRWAEYYHATNIPSSVDLPEREVTSSNVGLLTREVRIMPIEVDSLGVVTITLPDGRTLKGAFALIHAKT